MSDASMNNMRLHINQHTVLPLPLYSQGEVTVHDFHVEIKKQPNNL
jgi:hypothetical protein